MKQTIQWTKKVKNLNWHEADQLGTQGREQHLLPAIGQNGTKTRNLRIKTMT